jgi:rhamnosyltransferase
MKKIMGLIVTFNPSYTLFSNINIFLDQLEHIIIIDNGSNPEWRLLLEQEASHRTSSLTIIFNDTNLGVATALNQGFRWGIDQGYDAVVTFDQDSIPAPDMTHELLRAYNSHPNRDTIAIVAPRVEDQHANVHVRYLRPRNSFLFERVLCQDSTIEDVSIVITSGSLNSLDAYRKIGDFRDDFFIDYVDTEYCLRAKQHGYGILVACNATLQHRLGNQQMKHLGPFTLHPTFHPPLRWYYLNRNRIVMLGLYAFRFPHWGIYDLMAGSYSLLKLLLFEDGKLRKILALILGMFDGFSGHMGPVSTKRKASIYGKGISTNG